MADNLNVSIIMKLIDGVSAPVQRMVSNFERASKKIEAAQRLSDKYFRRAEHINQASESVHRFAERLDEITEKPIENAMSLQVAIVQLSHASRDGATDLAALTKQSTELAAGTEFTSLQVAESVTTLARAGLGTQDAFTQVGKAMVFASAHSLQLGDAAQITGGILKGFKVPGEQFAHVNDVITAAAQQAGQPVTEFGQALATTGPMARTVGVSLESTAGIMALLGKAGINASEGAGTVRTILSRLAGTDPRGLKRTTAALKKLGVDAYDSNKKLKDIPSLLQEIQGKVGGLQGVNQQRALAQLFGSGAAESMGALLNNLPPDAFGKIRESMEKAEGAAERLGEQMDTTAEQAKERLAASLDNLQTALGGPLLPGFTDMKNRLASVLGVFTRWTIQHPEIAKVLGVTARLVSVLATSLAGLFTVLAAYESFKGFTVLTKGYSRFVTVLSSGSGVLAAVGPFLLLAAAIAAVVLAISELVKHWDELNLKQGLQGMLDTAKEAAGFGTKAGGTIGGMPAEEFAKLHGLSDAGFSAKRVDPLALAGMATGLSMANPEALLKEHMAAIDPKAKMQESMATVKLELPDGMKVKTLSKKGRVDLDVSSGLSMATP